MRKGRRTLVIVPAVVAVLIVVAMVWDGQGLLPALFTAAFVGLCLVPVLAWVRDVNQLPKAGEAVWRDAASGLHYVNVNATPTGDDYLNMRTACGRHQLPMSEVLTRKTGEDVTCEACRTEQALGPPSQ